MSLREFFKKQNFVFIVFDPIPTFRTYVYVLSMILQVKKRLMKMTMAAFKGQFREKLEAGVPLVRIFRVTNELECKISVGMLLREVELLIGYTICVTRKIVHLHAPYS